MSRSSERYRFFSNRTGSRTAQKVLAIVLTLVLVTTMLPLGALAVASEGESQILPPPLAESTNGETVNPDQTNGTPTENTAGNPAQDLDPAQTPPKDASKTEATPDITTITALNPHPYTNPYASPDDPNLHRLVASYGTAFANIDFPTLLKATPEGGEENSYSLSVLEWQLARSETGDPSTVARPGTEPELSSYPASGATTDSGALQGFGSSAEAVAEAATETNVGETDTKKAPAFDPYTPGIYTFVPVLALQDTEQLADTVVLPELEVVLKPATGLGTLETLNPLAGPWTITFLNADGSNYDPYQVQFNDGTYCPDPGTPPLPAGKNAFLGWFDTTYLATVTGGADPDPDQRYDFDLPVTASVTLQAVFSANYLVQILDQNSLVVHSYVVVAGQKLAQPTPDYAPPTGQSFTGNYYTVAPDANPGQLFDFVNTAINRNYYLRAESDISWDVFFNTSGSQVKDQTVFDGQQIAITAEMPPVRAGYNFDHWSTTAAPTDTPFDLNTPITADVILYAVWTAGPVGFDLIFWVEKPNIVGDPGTQESNYQFAYQATVPAAAQYIAGTPLSDPQISALASGSYLTSAKSASVAMNYSHYGWSQNMTLNGDGSSTISLYFKRDIYTLVFDLRATKASINNTYGYAEVNTSDQGAWISMHGGQYQTATNPAKYSIEVKYEMIIGDDFPFGTAVHSGTGAYDLQGWMWSKTGWCNWANIDFVSTGVMSYVTAGATNYVITIAPFWRANLGSCYNLNYLEATAEDLAYISSNNITVRPYTDPYNGPGEAIDGQYFRKFVTYNSKTYSLVEGRTRLHVANPVIQGATDTALDLYTCLSGNRYIDLVLNSTKKVGYAYAFFARPSVVLTLDAGNGFIGANHTATMNFAYTSQITGLPTPTVPANTMFAGWYWDPNFSQPFLGTETMPGVTTTLFAKYESNANIITFLDKQGGNTVGTQGVATAGTVSDPNIYTVGQGYDGLGTFIGWYYQRAGNVMSFSWETQIYGDMTLFGYWQTTGFHVSYDLDGGTGADLPTDSATYDLASMATVLSPQNGSPTKTDAGGTTLVFAGWTLNGKVYYPGQHVSLYGDITLHARYIDPALSVTITFAPGAHPGAGGSVNWVAVSSAYQKGDAVTLPSAFDCGWTEVGYDVTGYNTDQSAAATGTVEAGYEVGTEHSFNASSTLYAVWGAQPVTISYSRNDGTLGAYTDGATLTGLYGSAIGTAPTPPARTGYSFKGWYSSVAVAEADASPYNNAWNFSSTLLTQANGVAQENGAATLKLYAGWQVNSYQINVNADPAAAVSGGMTASASHAYASQFALSYGTINPGYGFAGWTYTGAGSLTGANTATPTFIVGADTADIVANFTPNMATVDVQLDGAPYNSHGFAITLHPTSGSDLTPTPASADSAAVKFEAVPNDTYTVYVNGTATTNTLEVNNSGLVGVHTTLYYYSKAVSAATQYGGQDGTALTTGILVTFSSQVTQPPAAAFTVSYTGVSSVASTGVVTDGGDANPATWVIGVTGTWVNGASDVTVAVASWGEYLFADTTPKQVAAMYTPVLEATPDAHIDFVQEQLTNLDASATYRFSGTGLATASFTTDASGKTPVLSNWMGVTDFSLVKVGSSTTTDSLPQTLPIPSRPLASVVTTTNGVTLSSASDPSTGDVTGQLNNVTTAMEWQVALASTWTAVAVAGTIPSLAPNTYFVRMQAVQSTNTTGSFHSEAASFTVHDFGDIDFGRIYQGDPTPAPQKIQDEINTYLPPADAITVTSVAFDGGLSTDTNFTLVNATSASTVVPQTGLVPGIYQALLTVNYTDSTKSATLSPHVKFTVDALAAFTSVSADGSDSAVSTQLTVVFANPVWGSAVDTPLGASDFTISGGAVINGTPTTTDGITYTIPIKPTDQTTRDKTAIQVTLNIPATPGQNAMADAYALQKADVGTTITDNTAVVRTPRAVDTTDQFTYTLPGYNTSFIQFRLLTSPYLPLPDLETTPGVVSIVGTGTGGQGSATVDRVVHVDASFNSGFGGYTTYNVYLSNVVAGTVGIAFDGVSPAYDVQFTDQLSYTLVAGSKALGVRDYFLETYAGTNNPGTTYQNIATIPANGAQGPINLDAAGATVAPALSLPTSVEGLGGISVSKVLLDGTELASSKYSISVGASATYAYDDGAQTTLTSPYTLDLAAGFTNTIGAHLVEVIFSDDSYLYGQIDVSNITASYGIALSETGTYTFSPAPAGYSATSRSIDVTNTGNQDTGALFATLGGANLASFELIQSSSAVSPAPIASIANGSTTTGAFSVRPVSGLTKGSYTATVNVTGSNSIAASFTVSFTVTNTAPTVVSGQGTQNGNATPPSPDGTKPAVNYVVDAATIASWFSDADFAATPPDTLTYSVENTNASGSVSIDSGTGNLTYTPSVADGGSNRTIRIIANDGTANSTSAVTITIAVAPAQLNSTKSIDSFSVAGVAGVIDHTASTIAVTVPFGTDITAQIPTLTFRGSSVTPDSSASQDFSTSVPYTVVAADGSYKTYAVTVTVGPQTEFTVTYDINGADSGFAPFDDAGNDPNAPGLNSYKLGSTVTVLDNTGSMEKAGHVFTGWSTAADGTGTSFSITDIGTSRGTFVISQDTTLYAVWTPAIAIVFDGGGASGSIPAASVALGSTYGNPFDGAWPADPIRPGFGFLGWFTSSSGGTQITADTEVTDSAPLHILHAQWKENIYPVVQHFGTYLGTGTTTAKIAYENYLEFAYLVYDNKDQVVPSQDYAVTHGSTDITLTQAYAQTFPVGTHYFTAYFSYGRSVQIILVITEASEEIDNGLDDQNDQGQSSLPLTGDANVYAFIGAVAMALAGTALLATRRLRYKRRLN